MPLHTTFFMALAFLTRIPTPRLDIRDMSAAVAGALVWYPLIGLLLGCAATLPYLFLSPALAALTYVTLLVWLSRGLHWDGLADLCDACGACGTVSPDDTEALHHRFGQVLKDSRLGAFGAMGLVLGIGGEILLAADSAFPVLILAPIVGRSIPALMQKIVPPRANSTLAKLLGNGLASVWVAVHLVLAFALSCWILGPARACMLAGAVAVMIWRLCRLAKNTGGMNGDFFGAAIIGGELLTLLMSQIHLAR